MAVPHISICFEGTAAAYATFSPAAWLRNASMATRVWHCVHSVATPPANATGPLAEVVQRSKSLNAGLLYVTNDTMPNPYAGLPGEIFLEDLLRWAQNDF